MFDIFKLCELKGDTYEVDPAVIFPAIIQRIQDCVKSESPLEIVTPGWKGRAEREPVADRFLREAEAIPEAWWGLALKPFNECAAEELKPREAALGLAEQWFKRALSLAHGKGVKIHILKNLDWKR